MSKPHSTRNKSHRAERAVISAQHKAQIAADTRMNKIQGGLKSWMDEAYSKVLASAWDAHTFSGTSMPSVPDGESSPAIDPTNSSDSV